MIVHNKGNFVRNGNGLRLVPGVNKVEEQAWDEFAAHPLNQHLIEQGELVPQQRTVERVEGDQVKLETRTIGLVDMTAAEATTLIADTYSRELLEQFKDEETAGENRKAVLAAIAKQLKEIEKSFDEARQKAEQGEKEDE